MGSLGDENTAPTQDEDMNLYSVLGVDVSATPDQIKAAYTKMALQNHPDKRKSRECLEIFTRCAEAHKILSDPLKRALYDISAGIRVATPEERRKINKMKRAQAEREISCMEGSFELSRQAQEERNGLVIIDAKYGDLQTSKTKAGAVVNVTVPLQCLVDEGNSMIIIKGDSSKSELEGFYDPLDEGTSQLYVKYKFLSQLHECTVDDMDALMIPMQEHLIVESEKKQEVTFAEKRKQQRSDEDRKKRRRRWMLAAALASLFGFFVLRRYGYFQNIRLMGSGSSLMPFAVSPVLLRFFGSEPSSTQASKTA